jgi:hypothetical protein
MIVKTAIEGMKNYNFCEKMKIYGLSLFAGDYVHLSGLTFLVGAFRLIVYMAL